MHPSPQPNRSVPAASGMVSLARAGSSVGTSVRLKSGRSAVRPRPCPRAGAAGRSPRSAASVISAAPGPGQPRCAPCSSGGPGLRRLGMASSDGSSRGRHAMLVCAGRCPRRGACDRAAGIPHHDGGRGDRLHAIGALVARGAVNTPRTVLRPGSGRAAGAARRLHARPPHARPLALRRDGGIVAALPDDGPTLRDATEGEFLPAGQPPHPGRGGSGRPGALRGVHPHRPSGHLTGLGRRLLLRPPRAVPATPGRAGPPPAAST
jgi:hypothetical protein